MFEVPTKCIFDEKDLEEFKRSRSFEDIISFVKLCSESVIEAKISDELQPNDTILKFNEYIDSLMKIINETPPLQQPMRYGNKAFRLWHQQLEIETNTFLQKLLPDDLSAASIEIAPYLNQAFGNETRIDYGTGHELSMLLFFMILFKLGLLSKGDLKSTIMKGFSSYIKCMRKLQETYLLEPAGSHGVWGLDDYHCLTFVFGSAQLIGHETIRPSSINNNEIVNEFASDYLYLEGIQFIKRIKSKAPFHETSPMLYDISNISDWEHVHTGLHRLFQGEVLSKLPVIQHIPFGILIKCTWIPNRHTITSSPISHMSSTTGPVVFTEDHMKTIQQNNNFDEMIHTRAPWANTPSNVTGIHPRVLRPIHHVVTNITSSSSEVHSHLPPNNTQSKNEIHKNEHILSKD